MAVAKSAARGSKKVAAGDKPKSSARTTKVATPTSQQPPEITSYPVAPLVGRAELLLALRDKLAVAAAVVVHGGAGVGKSRLLVELSSQLEVPATIVHAMPGDTAPAMLSRVERAVGCLSGGLVEAIAERAQVVIIDDAHKLDAGELARTWLALVPGPTALGRVIIVGRERLMVGVGQGVAELVVNPLSEASAALLWQAYDGGDLPTSGDARAALQSGLPWLIRRAVASRKLGADAWALATVGPTKLARLQVLALARIGLPRLAWSALARNDVDEDLLERRQLVDLDQAGAASLAPPLVDVVLSTISVEERSAIHRRLSQLFANTPCDDAGWAVGQAAMARVDWLVRLREAVRHSLAAGDETRARNLINEGAARSMNGGAREEIEALVAGLGDPLHPFLIELRLALAYGAGRIAEAAELVASVPTLVTPRIRAEVSLALGDLDDASLYLDRIEPLVPGEVDAEVLAMRVELALARGLPDEAARLVRPGEPPKGGDVARARFLLARAAHEEFAGEIAAARATLGRAAALVQRGPEASALRTQIECRRATCLVLEGRLTEADTALAQAEQLARAIDHVGVADLLRLARARASIRRGDFTAAVLGLRRLVATRRERGDELGAMQAEVELADATVVCGDLIATVEIATALRAQATRRGLSYLAARARLCLASVDLLEARFDAAAATVAELRSGGHLDAAGAARADVLAAQLDASTTRGIDAIARAQRAGVSELRDDIDRGLAVAAVAVAAGEFGVGLESARNVAALAERAGRRGELAESLSLVARLELARGDHGSARAAATRAVREATSAGLIRTRVHGLLALAALARDEGQPEAAVAYARDASDFATQAGLPVERLTANAALDGLVGADVLADPTSPSAATMAAPAIEAAARLLADLGLTAQRPFRVIDADGSSSDVADASPELMRMATRSLAVDGVRETLWRRGNELADLRRRSLLKRLLFMFAGAPGRVFSKDEIVGVVWNVDYHPLRHDAALFTNIMRIRRLLGEDGAEIIQITDDGYRFVPPRDYLFVAPR